MANESTKPKIICIKSAEITDSEEDWINIGQIRKTVGLKGWLRVCLMTDFPDRFEPGEELLLKKQFGSPESVIVSEWRPHFSENTVDILLEDVDDCDKAAKYVNRLVVIPKEEREDLDSDDEFYPDELEGIEVLSPEGKNCGTVLRMEADAPCPYLVVATKKDGEVMIPFRRDFVSGVNKNDRTLKLVEDVSFHVPVE
jgi:16S rRNA processing protein RimM